MKAKKRYLILFILPGLLLFAVVFVYSTSQMFGTSFYEWRLTSKVSFVGFDNFVELFQDRNFIKAVSNTLIWVTLQCTIHVGIGVIIALILAKKEFYWKFFRTAYMIPVIISPAALGMLYLCLFNPKIGIVNSVINAIGPGGFNQNWFFDYSTAFFTVTMTWLPYAAVITIIVMAEMASIPRSLFESAKVDGANEFQINMLIVLPMLRNIIGTCIILAATGAMKNFDLIFMTTNGGPGNTTMNLPLYIYKTAMMDNNYGLANAASTFLVVLGFVIIFAVIKLSKLGKQVD